MQTDNTGSPGNETGLAESTQQDTMEAEVRSVPLKALQSERHKRQALEARIAEMEAAAQAKEDAEAAQRGEFRELWETRGKPAEDKARQLQERLEAFEAARSARQQARREALGEYAAGIPEGLDGDALDGLLDWAESIRSKSGSAAPTTKPVVPVGAGSADRAQPDGLVSERELAWIRKTKPSWMNVSESQQRVLLERFGPAWSKQSKR